VLDLDESTKRLQQAYSKAGAGAWGDGARGPRPLRGYTHAVNYPLVKGGIIFQGWWGWWVSRLVGCSDGS